MANKSEQHVHLEKESTLWCQHQALTVDYNHHNYILTCYQPINT